MAQLPIDKNQPAPEKRELARRARRLALTQLLDADRAKLTQFAAELDKEAEALEQSSPAASLSARNRAAAASAAPAGAAAAIDGKAYSAQEHRLGRSIATAAL